MSREASLLCLCVGFALLGALLSGQDSGAQGGRCGSWAVSPQGAAVEPVLQASGDFWPELREDI